MSCVNKDFLFPPPGPGKKDLSPKTTRLATLLERRVSPQRAKFWHVRQEQDAKNYTQSTLLSAAPGAYPDARTPNQLVATLCTLSVILLLLRFSFSRPADSPQGYSSCPWSFVKGSFRALFRRSIVCGEGCRQSCGHRVIRIGLRID